MTDRRRSFEPSQPPALLSVYARPWSALAADVASSRNSSQAPSLTKAIIVFVPSLLLRHFLSSLSFLFSPSHQHQIRICGLPFLVSKNCKENRPIERWLFENRAKPKAFFPVFFVSEIRFFCISDPAYDDVFLRRLATTIASGIVGAGMRIRDWAIYCSVPSWGRFLPCLSSPIDVVAEVSNCGGE